MFRERKVKRGEYIVSKTNKRGIITNVNEKFLDISGYSQSEVIGKPHNILRHSDMPRVLFALLWAKLKDEQDVNAFVKNRCKDGSYYWVFANVTPSYNMSTKILQGYYSIRKWPNPKAIEKIETLYEKLLEIEKQEGQKATIIKLKSILEHNKIKFNDLMNKIQSDSIDIDFKEYF